MENKIKVSVVVPIYNVEEYLDECLNSIANQSLQDIEVLMIDDGSTDNSARIAKDYEKKYSHFHYFYKENGGLGNARNYAIPYVKGEYLIFIDSDDIVPQNAYKKMYEMAIRTGNDMIIGNVKRFNSTKEWDSVLHRKLFDASYDHVHILTKPDLVYDTTSWNKLFKTSFYKENQFKFPENILYEDIPVTIPAHFKANSVGMIDDICYLWRVRDGVSKSITQNRTEIKNLSDRIKIMEMVNDFYNDNVTDETALFMRDFKWLDIDLKIYINKFLEVDNEYLDYAIGAIADFLKTIHKDTFSKIRVIDRLKYFYIQTNNREKLLEVLNFEKTYFKSMTIRKVSNHYIGQFPFDVDKEMLYMENELSNYNPVQAVKQIKWENDNLFINGYFYLPKLKNQSDLKVEAYLYNIHTNDKVPVSILRKESKELTSVYGKKYSLKPLRVSHYNYDNCGYEIKVSVKDKLDKLDGIYKLYIHYFDDIIDNTFMVSNNLSNKLKGNFLKFFDSKKVYTKFISENELEVYFMNYENIELIPNDSNTDILYLKNEYQKPLYIQNSNFDEEELLQNDGIIALDLHKIPNGVSKMYTKSKNYINHCSLYGEKKFLHFGEYFIVIANDDIGRLSIIKYSNACFMINALLNDKRMLIDIELDNHLFSECSLEPSLILKNKKFNYEVKCSIIEKMKTNNKTFYQMDISFMNYDFIKDLAGGDYDLYIEYDAIHQYPIVGHFNQFFNIDNGQYNYKFFINENAELSLSIHYMWDKKENSKVKRRLIRKYIYPLLRKLPLKKDVVVFESYWGKQYGCNPRYLYEYIQNEHKEYKCVWFFDDERIAIEGNAERVRRFSYKYYYYLAVAKYLVNNVNFHEFYEKREDQIEIQTMHGTPLKTLGLDVPGDFPTDEIRNSFIRKCKRWDYLIVQNNITSKITTSCYLFDKKFLRTGYPRNDLLFKNNNEAYIKELKMKLGLPLDKKIILYAPTWRRKNYFEMNLDVNDMKEKLGDEYILILRLHHFSVGGLKEDMLNDFVYNYSSYSSIQDLYLVSDILITDYSSVMFDYALLKRPMIFFTYDLDEYRDNLRGFNFDFEKATPFPLLKNYQEVIHCIENINEVMEENKENYTKFINEFTEYEDGNASQKVFDSVFRN